MRKTMMVAVLAGVAWCGGAYDPEKGTNFGACENDKAAVSGRGADFQAGDGGPAPSSGAEGE